jgi:nucleotide-binding universal stress UspA family protein
VKLHKIVVAVNDTPAAVHALREAALIATAAGAELVALTVVEDPWQKVEPQEVEGFRRVHGPPPAAVAEDRVREELDTLVNAAIGPGRAQLAVQFGLPGIELARWSELAGADLLVIGRQPWGELARRPTGRVTGGTLSRARMPCLLVPFGQRTWKRVIAALGAEPAASAVADAATAFAALWNTMPQFVHAEAHNAGGHLTTVAHGNAGAATVAAATVVYGDPVGEVLKVAREEHADTLVVGYHRGETAAEAGRVAPHLLERAPCAVLTVPV